MSRYNMAGTPGRREQHCETMEAEWMVTAGGMDFFPPTGGDRRAATKWLAGKDLFQFAISREDQTQILWQPNRFHPAVKRRMEAERAAAAAGAAAAATAAGGAASAGNKAESRS